MPLRLQRMLLPVSVLFIGLPCTLNGAPPPVDVPVRTIGHGLLVAPAFVNGQGPFNFVIDTGTNTTLLDPALAEHLGLVSEGVENLKTLTGATLVQRCRLASIAVGPKEVRDIPALVQPMSAVQKLDKHINGILGLQFLAHFSFGLDYANLRLRLYAADVPLEVHSGQRVPAQFVHDRLLLDVASPAAPHRSWHLALDSGISQILIFSNMSICRVRDAQLTCLEEDDGPSMRVAANPFVRGANSQTMHITTNQAETLTRSIVLQRVAIGELQFGNVPAVLLFVEGSAADSVVNGLLPACLFRSFFYDHATSTVLLNPD